MKLQATRMMNTGDGQQQLDINFQLDSGRVLALYGPSGAGKTTILRILAGLAKTDNCFVEVDGIIWDDSTRNIHLPTHRRPIGFVFQDFALFPNLTVQEQLTFALPAGANRGIVPDLLALMELGQLKDRRPSSLSGGQQQRVALARAIARRPKLLLLDEPLSALDEEMRSRLQDIILTAHHQYGLTTILVSHHLPEIRRLADDVIVLDKGRTMRQGIPAQVFAVSKVESAKLIGLTIPGEIVEIRLSDLLYIVSVNCGGTIAELRVPVAEGSRLEIGQKLVLTADNVNLGLFS